jgi:radial spoke head protein 3
MYDRRVVRGNTFAALVIPVNMQPESMTQQKKTVQRSQYQQETTQNYQPSDRALRSSQRGEQRNDWEALSDVSRQMDEFDIEPDYYIDLAPDAIFVPDIDGEDKQNFVDTSSVYDFELETRPIL